MTATSIKLFNEVKPFRQYFYYTWLIWAYGMFMSLHAQYLPRKKYFALYNFRNETNWTYRNSYASFAQISLIFWASTSQIFYMSKSNNKTCFL